MSKRDKITVSVWIAIVTLAVTVIVTGGGSAISYGKMEQRVTDIGCTAESADTRSIDNQSLISRIDGKLDIIIQQTEK